MNRVFSHAKPFNGDISKWTVSSAIDMSGMFSHSTSFNGDLSKWDVSRVTKMPDMFLHASSFNSDISKWDVSRVGSMDYMFWDATLFKRNLCGAAWVYSKAKKTMMFAGSSGSISRTVCTAKTPPVSPQVGIARLSASESILAQLLAKRPYYSYETETVVRVLGISRAEVCFNPIPEL